MENKKLAKAQTVLFSNNLFFELLTANVPATLFRTI